MYKLLSMNKNVEAENIVNSKEIGVCECVMRLFYLHLKKTHVRYAKSIGLKTKQVPHVKGTLLVLV